MIAKNPLDRSLFIVDRNAQWERWQTFKKAQIARLEILCSLPGLTPPPAVTERLRALRRLE